MYQLAKSYDYGVNTCGACLEKQREIDRLTEENQRLRAKLSQQKRKDQEGFFGSSTPSAQIPIKANSTAENHQKRGGAKPGHKGHGRKQHEEEEVDCIRTVCVEPLCPSCHSELLISGGYLVFHSIWHSRDSELQTDVAATDTAVIDPIPDQLSSTRNDRAEQLDKQTEPRNTAPRSKIAVEE